MRPESTHPGHRTSWPAIVALALVPLLAVGALMGLTLDRSERVQAAVVNLDEAVEVQGQIVPLGRQLAAAIMERDGENIDWVLADAKNAKDGLETGEYAAVVTIPRSFSAAATSFSENDADRATQATIDVDVSDNAPVTDTSLAQQIARLAADTVNETLTEGYLDGIYLGFNQVGEQFTTIVDGASQLADGASQLADGTGEASDGAVQLADGMELLADNAEALTAGGQNLRERGAQLRSGTDQLVSGLPGLADGVAQLDAGANELATGADELADGAGQLSAGIGEFADQTPQLVDGVSQLADGAEPLLGAIPDYTAGVKQVVGGVGQLSDGLDQVVAGLEQGGQQDFSQLEELSTGARALADGSRQLADGIAAAPVDYEELAEQLGQFSDGSEGIATGVVEANQVIQALASGRGVPTAELDAAAAQIAERAEFTCPVEDLEACDAMEAQFRAAVAAGVRGGFDAGIGTAATILTTTDPETGLSLADGAQYLADNADEFSAYIPVLVDGVAQLQPGTEQLSDGAEQLADGIDELVTGLTSIPEQMAQLQAGLQQLADGADQLATEAQPLADNADQLGSGATQLLVGIQQLDSEISALPDGVNQLDDGAAQLATGSRQLADGLDRYADGVGELNSGVGQLASGADQYADGVRAYIDGVDQYSRGVDQYADGVVSAYDGARQLSDGLVQLDDGAEQLADGLDTFAAELAAGADQVPSYDPDQRATLSSVVASPVDQDDSLIDASRTALVALLVVAGLWLAALAAYVVVNPVPSDLVASRAPSVSLWGRTLGLPAALAAGTGAVLGVVASVVLALPAGRGLGAVLLLAGLGASFVLVNHALSAWLGNVGRGIAVLLLVLSVVLGLSSAVPGWMSALAGISPVQNGLELVRTWLADGAGVIGLAGGALLIGVIALGLSYLAIATRRRLTAAQFRRRIGVA